jgi:uncharacterized protein YceH (UPF0502 family)
MENVKELPVLSEVEVRVLGSLMEKSKTTPDYYPMTLNALVAACNQKTSRYPVVDYDEQTVQAVLSSLKGRSLVATATGGGSRVIKYKHNFGTVYPVSDAALAIMCLLFLRGPQTPGELNTNSGRLYEFSGLESVMNVLQELSGQSPPFVRELPKRPGQKEARFVHLFGESSSDEEQDFSTQTVSRTSSSGLEQRVAELERQVAMLNSIVSRLNGGAS